MLPIVKDHILARIHRALEHRPKSELPAPMPVEKITAEETLGRFRDRLSGNGGELVRLENVNAARVWLDSFTKAFSGAACGHLVPAALRPGLPELPAHQAQLGVSWALGAVAETGSVLTDSRDGRRTQLLPPTHLVFVSEARLYPSLSEALAALKTDLPSAIGLHSGPSKSADIGQIMVKGVHGPGRLVVALIGDIGA